jgi:hypothetical protein
MSFTCLSHSLIVEASSRLSMHSTLVNVFTFVISPPNDYAVPCGILAVSDTTKMVKTDQSELKLGLGFLYQGIIDSYRVAMLVSRMGTERARNGLEFWDYP